jgi:hypothetical protein
VTNDFELVVHGLARMLAAYADRIVVVDTSVDGEEVDRHVDVALFDTFGHRARASTRSPGSSATRTSGRWRSSPGTSIPRWWRG